MRTALISIVLFFLTFRGICVSGSTVESRELGLADIPECGLLCMISAISTSECSLDDVECICDNTKLTRAVSQCILSNCTMADSLGTARVQASQCNLPHESKQTQMYYILGGVYAVALVFVVLRTIGKLISKGLGWDDLIVVFAIFLSLIPAASAFSMTRLGFGKHLWDLEDDTLLPILRYFYVAWSSYVVVLGLIKVSLVLFYLEIFNMPSFKIIAYVFLACIVVNSTIIFFLTIFICSPVDSFWDRNKKGKCMDLQGIAFANSACAIAQDVALMVLPLLFISRLQMHRRRKIAVGIMFAIGTFGCIATVLRLQTLAAFKISFDPTWDYVPVTIWTILELAAGFVCVSLPSTRLLMSRIIPESVKDFFSVVTNSSHKSGKAHKEPPALPPPPPPPPPLHSLPLSPPLSPSPSSRPQRGWQTPSTWSWISLGLPIDPRKSHFGNLWPRDSGSRLSSQSLSQTHSGSRHLTSALSNYSESDLAVTQPPVQERRTSIDWHDPFELPAKPEPFRLLHNNGDSCKSCNLHPDAITVLPRIGRPQGRSYSDGEQGGQRIYRGRKRSGTYYV